MRPHHRWRGWAVAAALACMLVAGRFVGAQAPGAAVVTSVIAGEGALTVVWDPPPGTAEDDIVSYDLRYIATSDDETVDTNWTVVTDAWTSGPRHYLLDGLSNDVSYDVQVRVETSSHGPWSDTVARTPSDPSGIWSNAPRLDLDVPVAGVISTSGDIDVFRVTVTEKTGVLIYTTGDFDASGELLDSRGQQLEQEFDASFFTTSNNFTVWRTLQPGTYYIAVAGVGLDTGAYVLHTETIPDSPSFETARPVEVDSATLGIVDPGWNADHYKLELSRRTDLLIRSSGPLFDSVGSVHDSDFEETHASDDGYLLQDRWFAIRARLDAGVHYIKVRGYSSYSTGPYVLHVDEVQEPGSSTSTAAALELGGVAAGRIESSSDVDYFRLDADRASLVQFVAVSDTAGLSGELLDGNGDRVTGARSEWDLGVDLLFAATLRATLAPGTYYFKVDTSESADVPGAGSTGAYSVAALEDTSYPSLLASCGPAGDEASDALYGCQWNVTNDGRFGGTEGEDINVEEAWDTAMGAGVTVTVVDTGADGLHEDLISNFDSSGSYDYAADAWLAAGSGYHGTAVAGLIAARDNTVGIRGVAPRATVRSYNLLRSHTLRNEADAMSRGASTTAVSNNSWGPYDFGNPARTTRLWELAVESGLADGSSGLGTFYVWAAGNGHDNDDDANLDEYVTFYGVTAVCAVNHHGVQTFYSEKGANLWVCAPSNDTGAAALTTTNSRGRYADNFGGTSGAAPQVAGVAALARSANPALSWRDLKLILAGSARKNHADDGGWETGAAKYESTTDNYEFNHTYGFGVVDAAAAVELAEDWTNVPELSSETAKASDGPVTAPSTETQFAQSTVSVGAEVQFVEFVEVRAALDASPLRDVALELVSPSGAVSQLLVQRGSRDSGPWGGLDSDDGAFRLGSARHLGEDPQGEWTLRLASRYRPGSPVVLQSWSLTVYGHRSTPGPPTITSVDGVTDPLTVAWDPPASAGESAVTGYDVRHIRSDASDKDTDSSWTVVDGAWSSGPLQYTITGLASGVSYDVQVRAVSSTGDGAWSDTVAAKLGDSAGAPSFPGSEDGVRAVAENTPAGTDVGAPIAAGDPDDDELTYTLDGTDAASFEIVPATGQLRTKGALDYEWQTTYSFGVTAADGSGFSDRITATVNVTDVNEPPVIAAVDDYYSTGILEGNDIAEMIGYHDPEGTDLVWTLSGPDADDFVIDDSDVDAFDLYVFGPHVELEFAAEPDYENPADADTDNVYEVSVHASDEANTTTLDVTVVVLNRFEPPELTGPGTPSYAENGTGDVATYQAEDPDGARSTGHWPARTGAPSPSTAGCSGSWLRPTSRAPPMPERPTQWPATTPTNWWYGCGTRARRTCRWRSR